MEPVTLKIPLPKAGLGVPTLPELNHSQLHAVKSVLQQPLSLIQVGVLTSKERVKEDAARGPPHSGCHQTRLRTAGRVHWLHRAPRVGFCVPHAPSPFAPPLRAPTPWLCPGRLVGNSGRSHRHPAALPFFITLMIPFLRGPPAPARRSRPPPSCTTWRTAAPGRCWWRRRQTWRWTSWRTRWGGFTCG